MKSAIFAMGAQVFTTFVNKWTAQRGYMSFGIFSCIAAIIANKPLHSRHFWLEIAKIKK